MELTTAVDNWLQDWMLRSPKTAAMTRAPVVRPPYLEMRYRNLMGEF